jgi:hypothetical protein
MHGGDAPQVQRMAAVRRTLQELLREMPQRPWHEVYAEALHVNDVIMRHARNRVETGETLDPGELDQLITAAGRAGLLAKGASDIGVAQRLALQTELAGKVVVQILGNVLDALDLPPEFRAWVHGRVHAELLAVEGADEHGQLVTSAATFEPPPGHLAVVQEIPALDQPGQPARDGASVAAAPPAGQPTGIDPGTAEAPSRGTSEPDDDGRRHFLFGDARTPPPDEDEDAPDLRSRRPLRAELVRVTEGTYADE